ncbi:alpha/beta hydrolase family protein [Kitasatospora sp. NPDC051853]|uniref:alpha/beta hydrolase family protein n=1 Tax=Kitasatospora sp. NPDC051853 TaxID=3364058 RepID=UPI0037B1E515
MRTAVLTTAVAAAVAAALPLTLTPAQAAAPQHGRGTLVSAEALTALSREATADYLLRHGYPTAAPATGTETYRLVYRTVTPDGRPTTASGLLALPREGHGRLRPVVFEHGTMTARADAPSTGPDARGESLLFAGSGYAAAAPDYLGLGTGPGPHPYADVASETTASVDLLRAARAFTARRGRPLDRRVLVTGFSQGGPAAMALGRALQDGADRHFALGALAPVSGPYDAEGAEMPAGFDGTLDPRSATYYFAYWLVAMNRLHPVYRDPAEVFRQPYAATVEGLFDGTHGSAEVAGALPATPAELLTPEFTARAARPTGALLDALRAQDSTCDWTPAAPVRLYAASGDRDVTILNARHCAARLAAHGTDVPLLDLGPIGHSPSKKAALPQILSWFQQLLPA